MSCGFIDVLSEHQAKEAVTLVHNLNKLWISRSPNVVPFYTLGAVTYIDACRSNEQYHKHRKVLNPVLLKNFSWLYDIVLEKLKTVFGPCELLSDVAYPGFHIFGTKLDETLHPYAIESMKKPLASLHVDLQYREHYSIWNHYGKIDYDDLFSFTLALELPRSGGGLYLWDDVDLTSQQIDTFNFQDPRDKENQVPTPRYIEYEVGKLFYHTGHILHQIAPATDLQDGDRRITLQGHGVNCQGVYKIYF